eukprot:689179-Pleurochrysis_carterae.AAC.1
MPRQSASPPSAAQSVSLSPALDPCGSVRAGRARARRKRSFAAAKACCRCLSPVAASAFLACRVWDAQSFAQCSPLEDKCVSAFVGFMAKPKVATMSTERFIHIAVSSIGARVAALLRVVLLQDRA